jgi:hypothetical protein
LQRVPAPGPVPYARREWVEDRDDFLEIGASDRAQWRRILSVFIKGLPALAAA